MCVMCNEKCDAQASMKLQLQWLKTKEATPELFKTNLGPSTEPCGTPWLIIQHNCLFDRICYPDKTVKVQMARFRLLTGGD